MMDTLADLAGRVTYLEQQMDVQKKFIHILMQMVPPDKKILMQQLTAAAQSFEGAIGNERVARRTGDFAVEAGAMGDTPELIVSTSQQLAAFFDDVPSHQKKAMQVWFENATLEETFDEVARWYRSRPAGSLTPAADDDAGVKSDKE